MDSKERLSLYLPVGISAALYIFISYFTERHESTFLLTSYSLLFGFYLWLAHKTKPCSVPHFLFVAIVFRLLFLFAMPNLSDDIYRFVWDGKLLLNGINPFEQLPSYYAQHGLPSGLTIDLYQLLNSPDYFTIYPPFAQLVFLVSVYFSPDSVLGSAVIMRLLIIVAEIVTIYTLIKLVDHYGINRKHVMWYALNPLVILELTGNLHYEAFMICFLVVGLYLYVNKKLIASAAFIALAISAKLLPLMLLPLFLRKVPVKKLFKYYSWVGLFTVLMFLPLVSYALLDGMSSSIGLYFQKFEFNASIYYLIREIGFSVKGYNVIGAVGPYLALLTFIFIIGVAWFKKQLDLPKLIMIVLTGYFLLATTVHPWYITTILAFAIFTHYRYVVLWSFLIFFTYMGYSQTGFQEALWVTTIEYVLVIVYILYETFKEKKPVIAGV